MVIRFVRFVSLLLLKVNTEEKWNLKAVCTLGNRRFIVSFKGEAIFCKVSLPYEKKEQGIPISL